MQLLRIINVQFMGEEMSRGSPMMSSMYNQEGAFLISGGWKWKKFREHAFVIGEANLE